MTWSQVKGWFFWLAVLLGASPMTPIPAFLMGINEGFGLGFSHWTILAIIWVYHNLYVIAWIFCLDDGLALKPLLNWRPKIAGKKRNLFANTLDTIQRVRQGRNPKWLPDLFQNKFFRHLKTFWEKIIKQKNRVWSFFVIKIKQLDKYLRRGKLSKIYLCFLKLAGYFLIPFQCLLKKILRPVLFYLSELMFFLPSAFVPGLFKFANVYCAIRRRPKELIIWAVVAQVRILFIFFFGKMAMFVAYDYFKAGVKFFINF